MLSPSLSLSLSLSLLLAYSFCGDMGVWGFLEKKRRCLLTERGGGFVFVQRDFETAANRACDNQKNVCADAANNGTGAFKVGDCDKQSGEFVLLLSSPASWRCYGV
jgi:hypothetical protein